jgi:hypothetical protein
MIQPVDAMNRQQIDSLNVEALQAEFELGFKYSGVIPRGHLRLQDAFRIRGMGESPAKLPLGASVMARCFHMVKPELDCTVECRLHRELSLLSDHISLKIRPALLKPHAA